MTPAWDDMVLVGRVARAHGIRGQVIVDPETDFPEARYAAGSVVFVNKPGGPVPLTMTSARFHRGRPVVGFEGVTTMNEAETLAGLELRIDASALHPLPEGTFYQHDLVGCAVETTDGIAVGTVSRVDGEGAGSRLVLSGPGGGEMQIPLAEEICVGIHLGARRIVVRPIEGLFDLNVTKRQEF